MLWKVRTRAQICALVLTFPLLIWTRAVYFRSKNSKNNFLGLIFYFLGLKSLKNNV